VKNKKKKWEKSGSLLIQVLNFELRSGSCNLETKFYCLIASEMNDIPVGRSDDLDAGIVLTRNYTYCCEYYRNCFYQSGTWTTIKFRSVVGCN